MSDIFKERHAKLGCMVLRLFPKVMQMILKDYITPKGLQKRFSKNDFRLVFTKNEVVLMENLPNIDDFTIEISYKILRFEFNMLDEPKCKWGNVPHDTEVEIGDDIQRLINATHSIIKINTEEVTAQYSEKMLKEIKCMVTRIDSYLEQDDLWNLYTSLCRSETDSSSIIQDLKSVKLIEESIPDTESDKRERYSRLSIPIIDIFPKILRDVIRTCEPVAKFLHQKCVPVLTRFYPEQQKIIEELQYSNSYDSLDVTSIYQILRRLKLISQPTKGWGTFPDKADINLGDDVERIRCYRNNLAHRSDTKIGKNEFNEYFNEFRSIGHRMDRNFSQPTNYEQEIVDYRTCGMDTAMQAKYENAMMEIENIKLRFEKRPIKFYWGDDFDTWLTNLRSLLREEKLEGRQKVRVQIIVQTENDVDSNIGLLNSLTEEINNGLIGIEFIVATKGSLVLIVDILLEMLETDNKLLTTLALFLEKILARITIVTSETIDIVVLPVEDSTQWNKPKSIGGQVCLEFDIEVQLLETDDKMEAQLIKIGDAILRHSNGSGTNQNITATLLPINLENTSTEESFTQAQTPVKYNLPVSVSLRQQLNIKKSENESQSITSCIKTGNTLVFTDCCDNRLIICNSDGTDIHHIPLSYTPHYITEIDSNTVAVGCIYDITILIINISTRSVTSTIKTSGYCRGISYNDNNLYVVVGGGIIHVMDLTGKVIRTIPLPSRRIHDITVDRDRLVCIDDTSIYCCSLDGKLMWEFKNDKFQDLTRVTTDNEGNVFVTNEETHTVIVISDDGKHHRELLTKSDGLNRPYGIYFDKKENILFVCNYTDEKGFLFDVKHKLT
ncbi:uncharacterized protein LOC143057051 isoform X2 [Mytilus galloprovincialis]|uniref:uncharacterized protein LOC143057051 isoform X2 n=1 Tax=Mytilus galloprovincialis TaxID=29158 RepID=UPI003F7C7495